MDKRQILVVGHSHIKALMRACEEQDGLGDGTQFEFLSVRDDRFAREGVSPDKPSSVKLDLLVNEFTARAQAADVVVFSLNGNEHNNLGMFDLPSRSLQAAEASIKACATANYHAWLKALLPCCGARGVLLLPPPPIESEEFILRTEKIKRIGKPLRLRRAQERRDLWQAQCDVLAETARSHGLDVFYPPEGVFSASGFLAEDCRKDISHGNVVYGQRVLQALLAHVSSEAFEARVSPRSVDRRIHPYRTLPDHCFWKQSVSQLSAEAVDPVVEPPFRIRIKDRVATAGSCFAQHISKHLRAGGFRFLDAEPDKGGGAEGQAFHDFSARYGNVYTARQLLQLFDRAFGYFRPIEQVWQTTDGRYCDPFRPTIQPGGYATREAVAEDARRHLRAVQRMFRQLDVFVFTLGLTECWYSRLDGAVYPMAPGVAGGEYDPERHAFANFGVGDVVGDMQLFIDKLRVVNPRARIILTVSPVPLAATYENRHVLVSTTYSKSVLRVAAEQLAIENQGVYYFPSYEIITGSHAAGGYFEPDRRGVTPAGVSHVMRIFMARMTEEGPPRRAESVDDLEAELEALGEAMCDEEMLAR